jgi:hypothetical protein
VTCGVDDELMALAVVVKIAAIVRIGAVVLVTVVILRFSSGIGHLVAFTGHRPA